ncbi:caspase family protein [Parvibaculaceae bacterium PLY_AMNH_Bact1]|nr:caspase family protein [Parvibaculaceae bacterium PLY_AMNH_Bact1]
MPARNLKILCVHGLGDHRNSTWEETWSQALDEAFPSQNKVSIEPIFITYDDIFEDTDISIWEATGALWKLAKSGTLSVGRERGWLDSVAERIRWTAGYVVAWVEDDGFQRKTRKLVLDAIKKHKPDIVLGHSLGSLITYNALTHGDAGGGDIAPILRKMNFVSLGSQIGNPFVVRNLTPGSVGALPTKAWYHLYNKHDDVFTEPLSLPRYPNFRQIETPFDLPGFADHRAEQYLAHKNTIEGVWRPIVENAIDGRSFSPSAHKTKRSKTLARSARRKPRRALLVGINDYPQEQDRLYGCVNDVFLMSSVLQECGFAPDEIRTCLDDRATASGILERLEWLLDDPQPNDERVFYFSGHGARIPEYGEDREPDHHLECLVPWDFDWSPQTAITDNHIASLYTQLPYDSRIAMIFDCCHSGGIHRDGGAKSRGLTPPDDIRHREMKWDVETQMWVARDFARLDRGFSRSKEYKEDFFGSNGATFRLGRAVPYHGMTSAQYDRLKKTTDEPVGPYLPLIMEACGESQLAYEYQHGVTSYGAFTYSLASILRRSAGQNPISFKQLVDSTRRQLGELQYDQVPQILGPDKVVNAKVPWRTF